MENYDLRETLHKTVDSQLAKLMGGLNHLLQDAKIGTADGALADVEINMFQMRIHHLVIIKSAQTLLQIAADLSVGSVLLNPKDRNEGVESLRQQLNQDIANALTPNSQLTNEVLNIHQSIIPPPPCPPLPKQISQLEEDDDVVFEGGSGFSSPPSGFLASLSTLKQEANPQADPDPRNIFPTSSLGDLFVFP